MSSDCKRAGEKWKEDNWMPLIHSIKNDNCILMLGPDVAMKEFEGGKKTLMQILSYQLAKKTKIEEFDDFDLKEVAENFLRESGLGRSYLEALIEAFFKDRENEIQDVHKNLAKIPFPLIITTCYDSIFYNALKKEPGKEPEEEWYNFRGKDKREVEHEGSREKPLIYHLYGSIKNSRSLVISNNDLLEFFTSIISGNPNLPGYIKTEIGDKDKSFLFVGFGLRNWYLRILLHTLKAEKRESLSFAIEKLNPTQLCDRDTIFFYQDNGYKIHIYEDKDPDSFVNELYERYTEGSHTTMPAGQPAMPAGQPPTVFICHAHEDKEFAADISKRLEKRNIEPWLDKKKIRGGVEWDALIEKTIKKDVDYFVVLQSKSLESMYEGYVNEEIELALRRQRRFRRRPFIIPLKIDDCNLMDEFEDIQTIDMSDEEALDDGINELVEVVIEEQQRRAKE